MKTYAHSQSFRSRADPGIGLYTGKQGEPLADELLVRDYMTTPATSIDVKEARLLDAALIIRRSGFRHLPIVDGDKLVGIITDRDISRYAPSMLSNISQEEYNAIFENTPLERVMTRDPLRVSPTSPVREAVAILHEKKLGCLPVVQDGKLVGILTVTDMLSLLHQILPGASQPVQP